MKKLVERRTLAEVVQLHKLEPSLCAVYVEGWADQAFLDWYMTECAEADCRVLPIDAVDLPDALVLANGLRVGNRGRVITLALALEGELGASDTHKVICVADRDFEVLLQPLPDCPFLLFTDYSCLEMYLVDERCLAKLLTVVIRSPLSPNDLLEAADAPLTETFLLRAANAALGWGTEIPRVSRSCSVRNGEVLFDRDGLVGKYLDKAVQRAALEQLEEVIDGLRALLPSDIRERVDGHDLLDFVAWLVPSDAHLRNPETLTRALFGCIECEVLAEAPLFMELSSRMAS